MIRVSPARKQQIDYIGISEDTLAFLKSQQEAFRHITNQVVDELYDRISHQPELLAIINAHSTIERLKGTQIWYFQSMVAGLIDEEYIDRRIFIGSIHSRIGLTTEWYLGTYMLYLDIATKHFKLAAPDKWIEIVFALSKMFNLDSQLVLESYEKAEKALIQKMADERQAMITKITTVVQELASMMLELNNSTQAVANTASYTSQLQEQSQQKVNSLNAQIDDIHMMGTVIRDVADQTHLLGLNAAIEAARAGEAGLGFQIVADEIRKLAESSKQSSKTIHTKLKEIGILLSDVKSGSDETAKLAHQQATNSQELASFVSMIENITEQLSNLQ
ncbi:MAG: globin-coupled sensor protein [Cohnella sp.]|nr:globin-coupled sensor protein [Cohnella sp.]